MLTIFSIPKPFLGQTDIIQRNAIQSWMKLGPDMEIFLCGDDAGVKEIASEYKLKYVSNIEKNEFGTPSIASAFRIIPKLSCNDNICYVNSDIMILSSLVRSLQQVNFDRFLMIGRRWNLDLSHPIDFTDESWEFSLLKMVQENGRLQPPFGSDYFVFPNSINWNMPEFSVGRPGWDTWMIYKARAEKIPLIDATASGITVHQNHNYSHIPFGKNINSYDGPEGQANRSFLSKGASTFGVKDATHFISEGKVRDAIDYKYLKYRVAHQVDLNPSGLLGIQLINRSMQWTLKLRRFVPFHLIERFFYSITR